MVGVKRKGNSVLLLSVKETANEMITELTEIIKAAFWSATLVSLTKFVIILL